LPNRHKRKSVTASRDRRAIRRGTSTIRELVSGYRIAYIDLQPRATTKGPLF
jgi:hypothetical protein